MTLAEVVQLYAPLVGLLGLAFWTGVLSEQVRNLRSRVGKLESEDSDADGRELAVLKSKMETVSEDMQGVKRAMEGVQRQLGNLMVRGGGQVHEFTGEA